MNQELYRKLLPVFTSDHFHAILREVQNVRQFHAAAALRKAPESVDFALRNIGCIHLFTAGLAELYRTVEPEVIEEIGFVSLVMFGTDHRVFQFMMLALAGEPEFTREAYDRIKAAHQKVDINEIVAGNGTEIDALIWMHHMGAAMGKYVVDWTVATSKDAVTRARKDVWNL